jgi:predicted O-linked N-acetylglucosamine transferase (SPINDLY family)
MLLSKVGMGQTLTSNAVLNTICSGDNFNIQMSFNQRITFFLEYNLNDGSGWNVYNNLSVTSSNANPSLYTFPAISLPLVSSVSIVDFRIRYSTGTTYLAGSSTTTSILLSRVWELHDQSKFEIYGFDTAGGDGSNYRKRIENSFSKILDCKLF